MSSPTPGEVFVRRFVLALCASAFSLSVLAAPGEAQIVSKLDPEFPREAVQAGVGKGLVKARMTLDGSGEVTPGRSARRAAAPW